MKRFAYAALVLVFCVPFAHAGIVIKKDGKVFLGRIEADDVNDRTLVLREPHAFGKPSVPGSTMTLDRADLRWFDAKADEPTDAYFDVFGDAALDPSWGQFYSKYVERKNAGKTPWTPIMPRLVAQPLTKLFRTCETSMRRPINWTVVEANGIVRFESLDKRARIHFFASDLAGDQALAVTRAALRRMGTNFVADKTGENGGEWITTLERKGRTMKALRRFVQTDRSTAFAVAYADERDFPALQSLLRESLETLKAREVPEPGSALSGPRGRCRRRSPRARPATGSRTSRPP